MAEFKIVNMDEQDKRKWKSQAAAMGLDMSEYLIASIRMGEQVREAERKRIERKAGGGKCTHEPLLELNGKKITGSKRCIHCGLNEAYWNVDRP